ncbi:hypothetical protein IC582_002812 [Cucumis melo]
MRMGAIGVWPDVSPRPVVEMYIDNPYQLHLISFHFMPRSHPFPFLLIGGSA